MTESKTNLWSPDEQAIFDEFSGRCARDGKIAVVLHEIVPKSRRPKTWNTPENRIPLCVDCHIWAHQYGTRRSKQELTRLRHDSKYRVV